MALLLKTAFKGYRWIFDDLRDPRADDYPLMSSVIYPIAIVTCYLMFVNKWGPEYMKHRRPFQLDKIIMVYNFLQVACNAILVIIATPLFLKLDPYCSPIDFSDNPDAVKILKLGYCYFLLKFSDFLDTVFFILRKKQSQVTFLHVYHHFGMFLLVWIACKFICGGHSVYLAYINAIVHVVMYTYYLLTSWDPEYKKSIWWKKHITQLQLLQFMLILVIYGSVMFRPDCAYPKIASYFIVPQNIFMVFLFGDFYWKTYVKPKAKKAVNNNNTR